MSFQIQCEVCGCRPHYLMAQDDGSIESFCANANHRKVLVNIPELVSHVAKGFEDDILRYKELLNMLYGQFGEKLDVNVKTAVRIFLDSQGGQENPKVQDDSTTDPAGLQHGASSHSDMQDAGGQTPRGGLRGSTGGQERQQTSSNKVRGSRKQ